MVEEDTGRRLITEKCLIAADVDQTILAQTNNRMEERLAFFRRIAPELVESARLGAHVGFVTGNSMHELCSRILSFLIEQLSTTADLTLITKFHFFCNSGGLYFHFPKSVVESVVARCKSKYGERLHKAFWHAVTVKAGEEISVQPQFIDAGYVQRCLIHEDDCDAINSILEESIREYQAALNDNLTCVEEKYDLAVVRNDEGNIVVPKIEKRAAVYRTGGMEKRAVVQITIKPVLSFRMARNGFAETLFGNDQRSRTVASVQEKLNRAGLGQYVARPGGRGSIDVTLERLDKSYALEFLIDHLRLQGNTSRGQQYGSNTVYFGDEVIVGGGNDYPVTRIPGLFVFAVNRDRELVPFMRDVFVPSAFFEGPEATADVLAKFNQLARHLLKEFPDRKLMKNAVEALKEDIFASRINDKLARLRSRGISVDDWQTLHTFVTLMARENSNTRHWLSVLAKELDAIMAELAMHPAAPVPPAPGASHPDWYPLTEHAGR